MSIYLNHPTINKWTLWAHLPHDTDWSMKSYKKIYTFRHVEEVIAVSETIPNILVENCIPAGASGAENIVG
jgi:hypothetical protein